MLITQPPLLLLWRPWYVRALQISIMFICKLFIE